MESNVPSKSHEIYSLRDILPSSSLLLVQSNLGPNNSSLVYNSKCQNEIFECFVSEVLKSHLSANTVFVFQEMSLAVCDSQAARNFFRKLDMVDPYDRDLNLLNHWGIPYRKKVDQKPSSFMTVQTMHTSDSHPSLLHYSIPFLHMKLRCYQKSLRFEKLISQPIFSKQDISKFTHTDTTFAPMSYIRPDWFHLLVYQLFFRSKLDFSLSLNLFILNVHLPKNQISETMTYLLICLLLDFAQYLLGYESVSNAGLLVVGDFNISVHKFSVSNMIHGLIKLPESQHLKQYSLEDWNLSYPADDTSSVCFSFHSHNVNIRKVEVKCLTKTQHGEKSLNLHSVLLYHCDVIQTRDLFLTKKEIEVQNENFLETYRKMVQEHALENDKLNFENKNLKDLLKEKEEQLKVINQEYDKRFSDFVKYVPPSVSWKAVSSLLNHICDPNIQKFLSVLIQCGSQQTNLTP